MANSGSRVRRITVQPGLFVADYTHAADELNPPEVKVEPEDPVTPGIFVISCPGKPLGQLQRVKDCVVIYAAVPGAVTVTVEPRHKSGSIEATVEIKRLGSDPLGVEDHTDGLVSLPSAMRLPAGVRSMDDQHKSAQSARSIKNVKLLGHVAGKGDVVAAAGQWIAGPENPARIEGIALVAADGDSRVPLRYRVRYEDKKSRDSAKPLNRDFVSFGDYAGTRRRALALVGLDIEVDDAFADYQITARALFLGSQVVEKVGTSVQLQGPTGREPLIGLSISVTSIRSSQPNDGGQNESSSIRNNRIVKSGQSSRVRVFRAVH